MQEQACQARSLLHLMHACRTRGRGGPCCWPPPQSGPERALHGMYLQTSWPLIPLCTPFQSRRWPRPGHPTPSPRGCMAGMHTAAHHFRGSAAYCVLHALRGPCGPHRARLRSSSTPRASPSPRTPPPVSIIHAVHVSPTPHRLGSTARAAGKLGGAGEGGGGVRTAKERTSTHM